MVLLRDVDVYKRQLLILLLPVLGLVLWGWTGPRGLRPVTSPEHSK